MIDLPDTGWFHRESGEALADANLINYDDWAGTEHDGARPTGWSTIASVPEHAAQTDSCESGALTNLIASVRPVRGATMCTWP